MQQPVTNAVSLDGGGFTAGFSNPRCLVNANQLLTSPPAYHRRAGSLANAMAGPTAAVRGLCSASIRQRPPHSGGATASLLRSRTHCAPASMARVTPMLTAPAKPLFSASSMRTVPAGAAFRTWAVSPASLPFSTHMNKLAAGFIEARLERALSVSPGRCQFTTTAATTGSRSSPVTAPSSITQGPTVSEGGVQLAALLAVGVVRWSFQARSRVKIRVDRF